MFDQCLTICCHLPTGLLALRRQLSRSRPAADQLLSAYLQQSPACNELQVRDTYLKLVIYLLLLYHNMVY
jgi:hypothetical protein